MTLTVPPPAPAPTGSDPDSYRMSIGDHLEELRLRLILALGGFAVALVFCLIFGTQVMAAFCAPLISVLQRHDITPLLYFTNVSDPFMVYIEISMISATAIAAPWIVWQLWQFIASGLYAHERRTVTRYVPLSLSLLIGGILFVYYLVLPWTLEFFVAFSLSIPMPQPASPTVTPTTQQVSRIDLLDGNPKDPVDGQEWFDRTTGQRKMFVMGKIRTVSFGPENLTMPIITLPDYIDLVFGMLLTFGLSFQLPLVVMAAVAVGIVERAALKGARRYVYFGMSIVAAAITPGDVITATVALMFPLIGLFELGIFLSRNVRRMELTAEEAAEM